MKVRELKEGFLEEGFLDDVAAAMRDADSFSDFFTNISGGNAKLNQLANKIFTDAERVLVSGQTNLRQPGITDADIPMDRLIIAVFNAAANFSKTSKNPVSRQDLFAHFKKYQQEILKGINAQARGANLAPAAAGEINKVLARQPAAAIPGAGLKGNLEGVSLVAAVTLLDIEYRRATDVDSDAAEGFEFTPEQLKFFKEVGNKILESLFTPGSDIHKLLLINQDFRDNMKKFVEQIVRQVQRDFANLSTEQLKARKDRYDQVVDPLELRSAMIGHIDPNDPRLPDTYDATMRDIIASYKDQFDSFISTWISLARVERAETGADVSQEAFSQLTQWADRALRLLDSLKIPATKPKAAGTRAGQEIPAAGQEKQTPSIFKDLEAAHDAGSEALKRALSANPDLSPADQRKIYDRAAAAAAGSAGR